MPEETIGVHSFPGARGHHTDGNILAGSKATQEESGTQSPRYAADGDSIAGPRGTRARHEGSLTLQPPATRL